jgi:hypothetical protein
LKFYATAENPHPVAAQLSMFGRFGNNLYQLAYLLITCQYLHIDRVFVPMDFLYFNHSFVTTTGISISVGDKSPFQHTLCSHFFFIDPNQYCMNMDLFSIVGTFRLQFLIRFGEFRASKNALYFHVRSGDVMEQSPPPTQYAPPPCKYYLEASGFYANDTSRILFSDSPANPCVAELLKLNAKLEITSVFHAVRELVHAQNFVLGRSTFSLALMLLSRYAGKSQFYSYAYQWSDIGTHWNCIETNVYYEKVLSKWVSSPDQIALLKTERCEKWSHVIWSLQFFHYHGKDGTPFHF